MFRSAMLQSNHPVIASGVAYLLRALFNRADTGALVAGDLELQAAGSVTDGALTVVDTSTGIVEVLGSKIKITGSGGSGGSHWSTTGLVGGSVSRSLGKTLLCDFNIASIQQTAFGLGTSASLSTSWEHVFYINLASDVYARGTDYVKCATYSAATDYSFAVVLGGYDVNGVPYKTGDTKANFTYGAAIFIKGGAFTAWTMLWRFPSGSTATLYPYFHSYAASAPVTYDNMKVPDVDLSDVLIPAFRLDTPTAPTAFTGVSDGLLRYKIQTMPSTGNIDVDFRRMDASNYWRARVTSAGAVQLIDKIGTVRATASGTAAVGGVVTVIYDGADASIHLNAGVGGTYAAMDLATEAGGQLTSLGTGGSVTFISANARTSATYGSSFGGV